MSIMQNSNEQNLNMNSYLSTSELNMPINGGNSNSYEENLNMDIFSSECEINMPNNDGNSLLDPLELPCYPVPDRSNNDGNSLLDPLELPCYPVPDTSNISNNNGNSFLDLGNLNMSSDPLPCYPIPGRSDNGRNYNSNQQNLNIDGFPSTSGINVPQNDDNYIIISSDEDENGEIQQSEMTRNLKRRYFETNQIETINKYRKVSRRFLLKAPTLDGSDSDEQCSEENNAERNTLLSNDISDHNMFSSLNEQENSEYANILEEMNFESLETFRGYKKKITYSNMTVRSNVEELRTHAQISSDLRIVIKKQVDVDVYRAHNNH